MRLVVTLLLVGCGRLGFGSTADDQAPPIDVPIDAAVDFGADCIVGLRFEEDTWAGTSDEVLDVCGTPQSGRAVGAASRVDDPLRGRVASFGAPDDCVIIPDEPELRLTGAVTMSAWIFPTALDTVSPYGVIAKRTTDQTDVAYAMFVWIGDRAFVDINNEDDEFSGARSIQNNRWTQITSVYDPAQPIASRTRIYVDGTLDTIAAETAAQITAYTSPLHIGCLPDPPGLYSLRGKLDDVAIWSRALDASQVDAWFAATKR